MAGPVTIGPTAPTDKQPFQTMVSTETVAVYVQNKSRMTLYVAFQDVQPTAQDSSGGQYNAVVLPGHQALIPVQSRGVSGRERSLNAMGAFTGSVWIMPRDYTGTNATSGTASSLVGIFVSAYGPYDPLPVTAVDQPVIDLSSQPRVIAMPSSGEISVTGQFVPSTVPQDAVIVNQTGVGGIIQTTGIMLYIYSFTVMPAWAPNLGAAQVKLRAQPVDILNTPIGAAVDMLTFVVTVAQAPLANQFTSTGFIFTPAAPYPVSIGQRPGARAINILLTLASGFGVTLDYNLNLGIANSNIFSIPSIGNGGVAPLLPPPPGANNTTLW